MGWAVGYDTTWLRDVGYGVPSECDHPNCDEQIDRGLAFVCGSDPMGGDHGCGLYFCGRHLVGYVEVGERLFDLCERCAADQQPFKPKPDTTEWLRHKRDDSSWQQWRNECPEGLRWLKAELGRRMGAHARRG